ncbi:MAG: PEP-CTERM sorting domain-containing protein [Tepidisphaeraceae bacterium]
MQKIHRFVATSAAVLTAGFIAQSTASAAAIITTPISGPTYSLTGFTSLPADVGPAKLEKVSGPGSGGSPGLTVGPLFAGPTTLKATFTSPVYQFGFMTDGFGGTTVVPSGTLGSDALAANQVITFGFNKFVGFSSATPFTSATITLNSATAPGGSANSITMTDFRFTPAPEPASFAMVGVAAGGLLVRRRRVQG